MGKIIFLVQIDRALIILKKLGEGPFEIDFEGKYNDESLNIERYNFSYVRKTFIRNQYDSIIGKLLGNLLNGVIPNNIKGTISIFNKVSYLGFDLCKFEVELYLSDRNPILISEVRHLMTIVDEEINPSLIYSVINHHHYIFSQRMGTIQIKNLAGVETPLDIKRSLHLINEISIKPDN